MSQLRDGVPLKRRLGGALERVVTVLSRMEDDMPAASCDATAVIISGERQAEASTSPNWMDLIVTPGASTPSGGAAAWAWSSVSNTWTEIPCVSSTATK